MSFAPILLKVCFMIRLAFIGPELAVTIVVLEYPAVSILVTLAYSDSSVLVVLA